jgi:hypothetical protein
VGVDEGAVRVERPAAEHALGIGRRHAHSKVFGARMRSRLTTAAFASSSLRRAAAISTG